MNLTSSRMNYLSRSLVPVLALAAVGQLHAAVPDNDSPASSIELTAGPAVTANNTGATVSGSEVIPAGFTSDTYAGSVWYHWTPVFSGWYEINTTESSIDTVLSVWTSVSDVLSLVHVNDEATEGKVSRVQFFASSDTTYKIAVAGRGASEAGEVSLRLFYVPDPFAKVVAASFEQTAVDVTNGATTSKAKLTIEASREIAEGTFNVIAPSGVLITSVSFSAANRVSGFVASGEYEVSFSLPQYIAAGGYTWNVSVANSALGKVASAGSQGLTPLGEDSDSTLAVVNNGAVDGYAQWVAANGGGSLSGLIGGSDSLGGDLSLDTYAFGLKGDPLQVEGSSLVSTGSPLIRTESDSGGEKHLRVEFSRLTNSAQQGVSYRVQFSDDLQEWEDATTPAQTLATNGLYEAVVVEDTVATTEAPRRFARVLVERSLP